MRTVPQLNLLVKSSNNEIGYLLSIDIVDFSILRYSVRRRAEIKTENNKKKTERNKKARKYTVVVKQFY